MKGAGKETFREAKKASGVRRAKVFHEQSKKRLPIGPGTKTDGIPVFCAYDELKPIGELKPNDRNPNHHPRKQLVLLAKVIKAQGWRNPIVVSKRSGLVVSGHGRLEAAKILGVKTAPVNFQDFGSEKLELAHMMADNRLAELAELDKKQAQELILELDAGGLDIELTGYDLDAIECALKPNGDGRETIPELEELKKKWKTESGQIWQLGDHRLGCGDCTDKDFVSKVMNGKRAGLFATDPPYLVDYDGQDRPARSFSEKSSAPAWGTYYHDLKLGDDPYGKFIDAAVLHAILENAAWYHWHAPPMMPYLLQCWQKHAAFMHQQIVWAKDRPIMGRLEFMTQHESCAFGWVRGQRPKRLKGENYSSLWTFAIVVPGQNLHPAQKPSDLFKIPI